ncbi:MAG TPA: hypothetical protein VHB21_06235, partial [Minicystis sp.]|nr:hypothetical protein [Minicystis sp.]
MNRTISWALGIGLAGAVAMAACSSSVSDTNGSGGGNGGTSSHTATASSSHASSTGQGGSGGTTSMGGDACSMACDHAASCGLDFCAQYQLDCSTSQGQCVAGCINGASCQDIMDAANMQGPVFACGVVCLTGGGSGGGSGTGGGSQGCFQCAGQPCGGDVFACQQDAQSGCGDWLNCAGACNGDVSCLGACDAMYPNAA